MSQPANVPKPQVRLWGVIASPFLLKMQALLDYAGFPWQRWPDQGTRWQARIMGTKLNLAKRRGKVGRFPLRDTERDEYPSVPFYQIDSGPFYYDSTGLALHLDQHPQCNTPPLCPQDPLPRFICQLIDEAFDEFGLYMVHHMRWVGSARTTPMGEMTARELRHVLPFGSQNSVARNLPRRQVRRCPYLFSVAPEGLQLGVSAALTPPPRAGFPETHSLLDAAWLQYLAAMEQLLKAQPYLLGDRFTLADASAYGQLSMNLVDGDAAERLQRVAPITYAWLQSIRDGRHLVSRGDLYLSDELQPLLNIIGRTFVPLMQQNRQAWLAARQLGVTEFNEPAFDQGLACYDGELLGFPFRAGVKSFQVVVWEDLLASWRELAPAQREQTADYLGAELCQQLNAESTSLVQG